MKNEKSISDIFEWAWRCGLDVQLSSKKSNVPLKWGERFQLREDSNFEASAPYMLE